MKRKWELFEPPACAADLAISRCGAFLEAAYIMMNTGQDFIKVLIVSCYLQGINDMCETLEMRSRIEGRYEEDR